MNGINGLRSVNGFLLSERLSVGAMVAPAMVDATIANNNTPHASRQIGAPWGVTFIRPSRSAEGIPEFAAPGRDGDAG